MSKRWVVGIGVWLVLVVGFLSLLGLGGAGDLSLLIPFLLEYWMYSLPILLLFAAIAFGAARLFVR